MPLKIHVEIQVPTTGTCWRYFRYWDDETYLKRFLKKEKKFMLEKKCLNHFMGEFSVQYWFIWHTLIWLIYCWIDWLLSHKCLALTWYEEIADNVVKNVVVIMIIWSQHCSSWSQSLCSWFHRVHCLDIAMLWIWNSFLFCLIESMIQFVHLHQHCTHCVRVPHIHRLGNCSGFGQISNFLPAISHKKSTAKADLFLNSLSHLWLGCFHHFRELRETLKLEF